MSSRTVAIVGASLGGVAAAENLRICGFQGEIILIGEEPHLPYDRPPLSKNILTQEAPTLESLLLKPSEWYEENKITLRLGEPVTELDAEHKTLKVGSEVIKADEIIIATGSKPRRLPTITEDPDIFHLRFWEDAEQMNTRLHSTKGHMVILGAGFIGLEVAASARACGWEVSIIERVRPLSRVLPRELSELCISRYEEGYNLHVGAEMTSVERAAAGLVVNLAAGDTIPADVVVVAVGGIPAVEWLEGSGLHVDNGIVCDDHGRSSAEGIWAIGDAARWQNHFTGAQHRVEQWQAAIEHAGIVASTIAGREVPGWQEAPYFWSDIEGGRIQFLGHCGPEMDVHSMKSEDKTAAIVGDRDGKLRGVFSQNFAKAIVRGRRQLAQEPTFEDSVSWVEGLAPKPVPAG